MSYRITEGERKHFAAIEDTHLIIERDPDNNERLWLILKDGDKLGQEPAGTHGQTTIPLSHLKLSQRINSNIITLKDLEWLSQTDLPDYGWKFRISGIFDANKYLEKIQLIRVNDTDYDENDVYLGDDFDDGRTPIISGEVALDKLIELSIRDNLHVGGDTTISGDLTVGGITKFKDLEVDGTLKVSGEATFRNNVSIDAEGITGYDGDGNPIYGTNTLTVNGDLDVDGQTKLDKVQIDEELVVISAAPATFNGGVTIQNNDLILENADIEGENASFDEDLSARNITAIAEYNDKGEYTTGGTVNAYRLNVETDATIHDNLSAGSIGTSKADISELNVSEIYGNGSGDPIQINDETQFNKDVVISGRTWTEQEDTGQVDSEGKPIYVTKTYSSNGSLTVAGYEDENGNLQGGDLTVYGNLYAKRKAYVSGGLEVAGNAYFKNATNFEDNVYIEDNLKVSGTFEVSGKAQLKDDIDLDGDAYFYKNVYVAGTKEENGNQTNGNLYVSGKTTLSGDLSITTYEKREYPYDPYLEEREFKLEFSAFEGLHISGEESEVSVDRSNITLDAPSVIIGTESEDEQNPKKLDVMIPSTFDREVTFVSDVEGWGIFAWETNGHDDENGDYISGTFSVKSERVDIKGSFDPGEEPKLNDNDASKVERDGVVAITDVITPVNPFDAVPKWYVDNIKAKLERNVVADVACGAIEKGVTLEEGMTFTEFVEKLLTYIPPKIKSFMLTPISNGEYYVGEEAQFQLSAEVERESRLYQVHFSVKEIDSNGEYSVIRLDQIYPNTITYLADDHLAKSSIFKVKNNFEFKIIVTDTLPTNVQVEGNFNDFESWDFPKVKNLKVNLTPSIAIDKLVKGDSYTIDSFEFDIQPSEDDFSGPEDTIKEITVTNNSTGATIEGELKKDPNSNHYIFTPKDSLDATSEENSVTYQVQVENDDGNYGDDTIKLEYADYELLIKDLILNYDSTGQLYSIEYELELPANRTDPSMFFLRAVTRSEFPSDDNYVSSFKNCVNTPGTTKFKAEIGFPVNPDTYREFILKDGEVVTIKVIDGLRPSSLQDRDAAYKSSAPASVGSPTLEISNLQVYFAKDDAGLVKGDEYSFEYATFDIDSGDIDDLKLIRLYIDNSIISDTDNKFDYERTNNTIKLILKENNTHTVSMPEEKTVTFKVICQKNDNSTAETYTNEIQLKDYKFSIESLTLSYPSDKLESIEYELNKPLNRTDQDSFTLTKVIRSSNPNTPITGSLFDVTFDINTNKYTATYKTIYAAITLVKDETITIYVEDDFRQLSDKEVYKTSDPVILAANPKIESMEIILNDEVTGEVKEIKLTMANENPFKIAAFGLVGANGVYSHLSNLDIANSYSGNTVYTIQLQTPFNVENNGLYAIVITKSNGTTGVTEDDPDWVNDPVTNYSYSYRIYLKPEIQTVILNKHIESNKYVFDNFEITFTNNAHTSMYNVYSITRINSDETTSPVTDSFIKEIDYSMLDGKDRIYLESNKTLDLTDGERYDIVIVYKNAEPTPKVSNAFTVHVNFSIPEIESIEPIFPLVNNEIDDYSGDLKSLRLTMKDDSPFVIDSITIDDPMGGSLIPITGKFDTTIINNGGTNIFDIDVTEALFKVYNNAVIKVTISSGSNNDSEDCHIYLRPKISDPEIVVDESGLYLNIITLKLLKPIKYESPTYKIESILFKGDDLKNSFDDLDMLSESPLDPDHINDHYRIVPKVANSIEVNTGEVFVVKISYTNNSGDENIKIGEVNIIVPVINVIPEKSYIYYGSTAENMPPQSSLLNMLPNVIAHFENLDLDALVDNYFMKKDIATLNYKLTPEEKVIFPLPIEKLFEIKNAPSDHKDVTFFFIPSNKSFNDAKNITSEDILKNGDIGNMGFFKSNNTITNNNVTYDVFYNAKNQSGDSWNIYIKE
jgi:hypothetical protein